MIDFESLGYKDITKDKPIHFRECLGEFFDSTYPYSKRFYKQEENIAIELIVGNCYNVYFISGICYHPKGWEKFEVCAPEDYVNKMFTQTFNAVKLKINRKKTMVIIKEDCFSCDWFNLRHIGSDMPKCDKLGKSTNPYDPICNHDNN